MQQQLGETAMTEAQAHWSESGAGPLVRIGHPPLHAWPRPGATTNTAHSFNLAVHTYNQGVREFKAAEDDLDAIDTALADASQALAACLAPCWNRPSPKTAPKPRGIEALWRSYRPHCSTKTESSGARRTSKELEGD